MYKRLYIYPILSMMIIGIMLFLLFVTNLGSDGSLFVPFGLSILIVAFISIIGIIISLYLLIKKKQELHKIFFFIGINMVIVIGYYMWFLNNISGM